MAGGFRAFIGAAPLKLLESPRAHGRGRRFRAFIGAAPLKQDRRSPPPRLPLQFPRLHRRDPIEAAHCRTAANASTRFPRLHRRGPIEADRPPCAA